MQQIGAQRKHLIFAAHLHTRIYSDAVRGNTLLVGENSTLAVGTHTLCVVCGLTLHTVNTQDEYKLS